MEGVYVLRSGNQSSVQAGHTIVLTKTVQVDLVWDNYGVPARTMIKADDGNRYTLSDDQWKWEFATPKQWPALPGDVWESNGVRYAAVQRDSQLILSPMNSETAAVVFPSDHDKFLETHPILIFRG